MTAVWRGMSKEMGTRWSGYRPPVSALIETSLEHRQPDMTWTDRDVTRLSMWDCGTPKDSKSIVLLIKGV